MSDHNKTSISGFVDEVKACLTSGKELTCRGVIWHNGYQFVFYEIPLGTDEMGRWLWWFSEISDKCNPKHFNELVGTSYGQLSVGEIQQCFMENYENLSRLSLPLKFDELVRKPSEEAYIMHKLAR
jgi:hypothetical protein